MNYKSYRDIKTATSRMTRKRMRRDVFTANKKAAKLARKARQIERKSQAEAEQVEE
jgi:hypothetical protein